MLFNSYLFLFIFLPLCLAGFYLLKEKQATLAKVWLTCFSLWFYGYFNIFYLLIMLASICGNYLIHKEIIKSREKQKNNVDKLLLTLGVSGNLLVLVYFKYYDFFVENINTLWNTGLTVRGILLPLGISFFTFQQISFLADTYRRELKKCNFVDYSLFVSFFPQLIAGPIVTYEEMLPQFHRIGKDNRRKRELQELFLQGIYVFILGLAKKVLLADTFGRAVDYSYNNVAGINGLESFLVIIFYSLQLYFDFSGYCDMAMGVSKMLGFSLPLNFHSPYKAENIIEFWKGWHMTLTRFFTSYLYIPLGGSRKGRGRTYLNVLLVFLVSGIWHGVGITFIVWGLLHGVLNVITRWWQEKRGKKEKSKAIRLLCVAATFLYVNVAWVFFRAPSLPVAAEVLKKLSTFDFAKINRNFAECFILDEFWYVIKVLRLDRYDWADYILMFVILIVSLLIVFLSKTAVQISEKMKPTIVNTIVLSVLLIWCILTFSEVSTFLYVNF